MNGKGIHITSKILGGFFAFFFLCVIASHDKHFQKFIASFITEKVDGVIDGKLSFSSVTISPYGAFVIKDVLVSDPTPYTADTFGKGYAPTDTLFYAGSVTASFSFQALFDGEGLHLGRVRVENGGLFLVSEPEDERGRKNNMAILIKPKQRDTSYVAQPGPAIFDIRRVNISDFRFRLVNFAKEPKEGGKAYSGTGINFEDIDAVVNLRAHGVKFAGGRMGGGIDHMDIREKCGYAISELTGDAISGLGKTEISDLHLVDSESDISLKFLNLSFKNITYWRDFVNKIQIDADLKKSLVAVSTLNNFSRGSLSGNELVFDVAGGRIQGTVNKLDFHELVFVETLSEVSGTAEVHLDDVSPDVNNLMLNAKVDGCSFTSRGMSVFLTNFSRKNGKNVNLSKLAPHESLVADLFCKGNVNDLDVGTDLGNRTFGMLHFTGNVKEAYRKSTPIAVNGIFTTDSLHVGRTIGNDKVGALDSEGAFSVALSKPMRFTLDSLKMDRIDALDHVFHSIDVRGNLEDNTLSGQIASSDPALEASLVALYDLKGFEGKRRLRVGATIDNADIHELGLDKRGGASRIKAVIYSNMVEEDDIILGDAFVDNLNVDYGNGMTQVGDITLRAYQRDEEQLIRLTSPFADIDYSSTGSIGDFLNDLQDMTTRKYLPSLVGKPAVKDSCENYQISVDFHDSRRLMSYVMPSLYISDSTTLHLSLNDGLVGAEINSPRLALGSRFVRNFTLKVSNDSTTLGASATMEELNTGGMVILDPTVNISAVSDSALIDIKYDNVNGNESFGDLRLGTRFSRDEDNTLGMNIEPHGSSFGFGNEVWTISDSPVVIKGKDFRIRNLDIANGTQSLHFDGGYSPDKTDTLVVYLNRFDLSLIDYFLSEQIGFRGITTGQALISSPAETNLGMLVNVSCDSLEVAGTKAGTFSISSLWDEKDKKINAILRNTFDGRDIFTSEINYKPDEKEFGASAEFKDFALGVAAPLLTGIFSEVGGHLSGSIQIDGKGKEDLSVASNGIMLSDARVRLGATGVSYTLNGPINVDDSGILLEKMNIRDDNNGNGTLVGTVSHTKLSKLSLDATATLRDLDVIDIPDGKSFSGHVKATGDLKVKGPLNGLEVDANLVTSNNGNLHIPLSGALSSEKNDLLTFVEPYKVIDPYEEMLSEQTVQEEKVKTDFKAKGRIRLTPGITAFMEINKSSGNIITISGDGEVNIELQPLRKQFNLDGMYMINKGNYHFVLPGILEKDFDIQNGSFVKFGGDVGDTEMDISAIYQTRTSLSTLIADSTVVGSRRIVECGLNISGKLNKPDIKFSVEVPDLDPTTKSKIDGALNTEDKIQKQFVALLLFGSFLPSEQSGVFNQNNILYSNIGEVVSSQINSIFQKLDIPLDIGLGYQETTTGNNAFDVAVSTQLFNNRVVVNGSVGNRKYNSGTATTTSGDIVGDIDIEFKLDKEGKFRLNAFSHSADQYTSYLDNSQRNGLGASYQQEYNTFREFWRNIFKKKSKKDEDPATAPKPVEEVGNVIIKIENDNRKAISDSLDVR